MDEFVENVRENVYQAVDEYMDGNASQPNITICSICGGTGQQYISNLFYDTVVGWHGGYVACSGCGGMGYY